MRLAPASVYRNLLYLFGGVFVFYTVYNIIGYDEGDTHAQSQRRQKHLFLTVSKDRIADRFGTLSPKRILLWNTIFGSTFSPELFRECRGLEDRCIVVNNKSQVASADVVALHGPNIVSNDLPDPATRSSSQIYVFFSMETPKNTQLIAGKTPEHFFNWTQTYLLSSDVIWKYGPFWIESREAAERGFKMESFYIEPEKLKKSKSGVFGLISNCDAKDRHRFVKELSKHMNVTVGGKCATSPALKNICPMGERCQDKFEEYPFYFALENSICKDYVTEKYWERIRFAGIPIVWKRSIMQSTNPPSQSFIAVDDYSSIKEMAEHLVKLENDPVLYAEYFQWRVKHQWTIAPWNTKGFRNGMCKLCEKLWDGPHESKSYPDITAWFEKEGQCETDDFFRLYFS